MGIYGRPLVTGTSSEQTLTLDPQGLLGALFSAVAGAEGARAPSAQVQAAPLSVKARTTYSGPASRP